MAVLLVADRVLTLDPARPWARCLVVGGETIRWVGDDPAQAPAHDQVIDLSGATLQPAFVDAHVHLTATGLGLSGLDLGDCNSVDDCLAAVRAIADITPGRVIWGGGWDDSRFPEGRPPSADELATAAGGRPVLLTRTDGHSAVMDRVSIEAAPLARAAGVERDASGRPTGLVRREANHLARRWFLAGLPSSQLAAARREVAAHAAALGIASVHEMGGPDLMGEEDFDAWRRGTWPIEVVPYWGATDLDFVVERGLRRVGGDLFLDGTLGSRTAALEEDYLDGRGAGHLYESTEELVEFTLEATRRRVQVGYHCIGDRAVRQAVEVFEAVAGQLGVDAVRAARHRLEHCELVPSDLPPRMAYLGLVASIQPGFDRAWGAPGDMYEKRLGPERAALMKPFRPLLRAGVTLAIGSDSNVTAMGPWAAVRDAVNHHHRAFRLTPDQALEAAIVGGRKAARQDGVGRVMTGERADLAAFASTPARAEDWPVAGGWEMSTSVMTMVRGRPVHGEAADHDR
jgi:predicted amidohydrolase YtcJ